MKRIVAFDTETFYNKEVSIKTLGNWAYTRHPQFECYLISVYDGKDSWAGHPKDFDSEKWLAGNVILSHNAGFDISVYQSLLEKGILSPVDIPEWHCTADMSAFLCGYRDLKNATKYLLGAELSKKVRGAAEGKNFAYFHAHPEEWREMRKYAVSDVYYCWKLWDLFSTDWPEFERRLSDAGVYSAMHGVMINWALLDSYRDAVSAALQEVRGKIPWVATGEPPTSPVSIAKACQEAGLSLPPVKYQDEEGYQRWLDDNAEKAPWVSAISEHRKVNKMLSFLDSVRVRRRTDDRIDAQLLYYGAHTGRWSGSLGEKSAGINLQNLRKEPLVLPDGTGVHQRHLFVPRLGYKFVIADYAQIEARVLNWLAGNTELLSLLTEQGMNIYEAHARSTMGWTGGVLKEEDPKKYALAKARVLMLGYGAGWVKFQSTAFKLLGMKLSEEEARQIVTDFRETNPLICALWAALGDQIREAHSWKEEAERRVDIILPSGRRVTYYEVEMTRVTRERPKKDNPEEMESYLATEYTARLGPYRRRVYGGLATENLVQATARDIFAHGLLALLDRGWAVPIHVHDEVVVEVPYGVPAEEVVAVLKGAAPEWAEGCPIDVEAGDALHYQKD